MTMRTCLSIGYVIGLAMGLCIGLAVPKVVTKFQDGWMADSEAPGCGTDGNVVRPPVSHAKQMREYLERHLDDPRDMEFLSWGLVKRFNNGKMFSYEQVAIRCRNANGGRHVTVRDFSFTDDKIDYK